MQKIINNLRSQPEHIKRYVLHAVIIIAGVVLFVIWVYSLGGKLNSVASKNDLKESLAPLSVLKNNLAMPKW